MENDYLSDHLEQLFEGGLPWDTENSYDLNSVNIYVELTNKTFLRVNKSNTIIEIITKENFSLQMILEIYIVSPKSKYFNIFMAQNKISN